MQDTIAQIKMTSEQGPEKDNYLTIQLLSYDRPTTQTERYYFLEMSTLQATTLILADKRIVSARIIAYLQYIWVNGVGFKLYISIRR